MKKTKMEKGITLVALIITIVILLILAAVAIAAIQNENILSHANNAAIKYNGSVDNEQGILGGYLDVLDKYTGNEWITIYEGNAVTEEGMAVLGEGDLFAYGSAGVPYKITVSSDEFSGTVETVPILVASEGEMNGYYLFAVENGEAIGFTSMEDANNKLDNCGENATAVVGVSQDGICAIALEGATCEYTITKIERKDIKINGTLIWEGNITDSNNTSFVGNIDITKEYFVECGGIVYNLTKVVWFLSEFVITSSEFDCLITCRKEDNGVIITNGVLGEKIRIYEGGNNSAIAIEGEYMARRDDVDKWVLIDGPFSTGIPETVQGKTITSIETNEINVYYNREVELRSVRDGNLIIKVASSVNLERFFELVHISSYGYEIDLTEFSEAIIPESVLLSSLNPTIYVTSEVKANYADYDNVVVKE